uniref:Ig-like domain-containing protein n=1 Tax=Iconisemion striatum TaxID=60296 RepID=A0A1A7WLD8_9TELE
MRAVALVLLAVLTVVQAQNSYQEEQFGVGVELVLRPVDPPNPITSITWKRNDDIVAELIQVGSEIEYFGVLKDRSKLDRTTGVLTISSMKKSDEGKFTVEINSKVQSVGFKVVEVQPVPEPEVILRPLTCSEAFTQCKLSCEPKGGSLSNAVPVQYFWTLGGKREPGIESKDINITNDEKTKAIKTFSCSIKNKISQKQSEQLDNPFNKKPGGTGGGLVAGIIVGVFALICLVLVVVGIIFREKIKPYLPCFGDYRQPGHEDLALNGAGESKP